MTAPLPEGLQQADDYIKAGQIQQAQPLLVRYIKQHPDSAEGWYLMSFVVPQQAQQIDCLQRVLRYDPTHRHAQARLVEVMTGQTTEPPQTALSPSTFMSAADSAQRTEDIQRDEDAWQAEAARIEQVAHPERVVPEEKRAAPAPIGPKPAPAPGEFANLRSKLAAPMKERRKPRRSYKALLTVLIIMVLIAAGGTAFVVLINRQAEEAAAVLDASATPTATPTDIPTETPTPSITPTRFPPTWTATPPATPRPTHTPTPLPTVDVTQDADLRTVQQAVATLRDLPAAELSAVYSVPPDQVESVVMNSLDSARAFDALPDQARLLNALGVIDPAYTLELYITNRQIDPTGGYYDSRAREIFVIGDRPLGVQHQAFAMEVARAVIAQNYDIDQTGLSPACKFDTQRCQAIHAFITGDATLATQQWLRQSATAKDRSEAQAYRLPDLVLPDNLAPLYVVRDVNFARTAGLAFVQALYQRGGWARVNSAYDDPPLSTEQILHPEKYLANEQPIELAAVPLTDTLGADWQLIADDVLGEWHTDLLLSANADERLRIPAEAARSAARGWGGDRVQAYYNAKTDETVLAIAWTWDSVADAREFKLALSAYLDLRFGVAKTSPGDGEDCWQASSEAGCLFTSNKNSLWLLAPQSDQIDAMKAVYTSFP